ILILAQPQEIIGSDFPGQSKPFRTDANPFAGHPLPFVVVIANTEVLLEVFPRVLEIVLRLCRDHAGHSVTAIRLRSVSATQKSGLRSEEHTSELQSLAYLVCRLLLEK